MSGFQRFISYIHCYQNGDRMRNVGFAKLELRGGWLRAQLHIREQRLSRPAWLEVFFFAREQEGLKGIRLGKMKVEKGCGETRIQVRADDVVGSGYRFHQLSGLILRAEESGQFYGAEWDGQEIRPELFLETGERTRQGVQAAEVTLEQPEEIPFRDREKMENSEGRWDYLCRNYPSIMPFREEDPAECIKIQLNDLQILPREEWRLCNNSFLLHGYYSYRHLIFGKNREEGDYFIGVPGTYYPQEKLFAVMTGFPEFKTAAGTARKAGEFGYWCRQIRYDIG